MIKNAEEGKNASFGFSFDLQTVNDGEIGTADTDKGIYWRLHDSTTTATTDITGYKKNLNIRNIFNLVSPLWFPLLSFVFSYWCSLASLLI